MADAVRKLQRETFNEQHLDDALELLPPGLFASWLCRYLGHAPLSLALREINRLVILQATLKNIGIGNGDPVLDVGCGDGFWWTFLEDAIPNIYGIDIATKELRLASQHLTATANINISAQDFTQQLTELAWPSKYSFIVGNCSLEHVPELDHALQNINRILDPAGVFLLFVPTQTWAHHGRTMDLLSRVAPRLAMTASGAMNGFFQHWHLYNDSLWHILLEHHGFHVDKIVYMGKQKSEYLFRLGLPSAFLSFFFKQIAGAYPNTFSPLILRKIIAEWTSQFLLGSKPDKHSHERAFAYEYAFICHKS